MLQSQTHDYVANLDFGISVTAVQERIYYFHLEKKLKFFLLLLLRGTPISSATQVKYPVVTLNQKSN